MSLEGGQFASSSGGDPGADRTTFDAGGWRFCGRRAACDGGGRGRAGWGAYGVVVGRAGSSGRRVCGPGEWGLGLVLGVDLEIGAEAETEAETETETEAEAESGAEAVAEAVAVSEWVFDRSWHENLT